MRVQVYRQDQPQAAVVTLTIMPGQTTLGHLRAQVHTLTGSRAETPECWNLELQQAEIFADNFLIVAVNFYILQA